MKRAYLWFVWGGVVLLGIALLSSCDRSKSAALTPVQLREQLHAKVRDWVSSDNLARADGFTYAVDVGQLLTYAARSGDREFYALLRTRAQRFVIDQADDESTRGFVAWREKAGVPHDASGTTEALRMAEGFWEGFKAFGSDDDRAKAILILRGYTRHAGVDNGVWFIRNYFNLGTRDFATNSFLVDYDPDLLQEVGKATNDQAMLDAAERSYALVKQAAAPSGLIYDIVQPEVLTLMPDFGMTAFSPNDIVQLSNSCTVAERCVVGLPQISKTVLRFAVTREQNLNTYYLGRTGEEADALAPAKPGAPVAAKSHVPGPETYGPLVRLAAKQGDHAAAAFFLRHLTAEAQAFLDKPYEPRLYTASEILLGLQMAEKEQKR